MLGLGPAIVIMAVTGWAAATAMHRWIPPHPQPI
jgi:H+/gluconate symporter-like permease